MRKKISLLVLSIITISLMASVSALARWNPGDPYIPCYEFEQTYNYPTTTIAGGQTVSFDISSNPCAPVKMIQIGQELNRQQDPNEPTYRYECSLSSDQGCCVDDGSSIYVSTVGCIQTFSVTTYDAQGPILGPFGPGQGCFVELGTNAEGRKATRFVVTNTDQEEPITVTSTLYSECCYDCRMKREPPATILYPKVDIENFAVAGGAAIINNGKLLTNLTLSPGVQQTFIQVENRGFFTQNDTRIRFDGLPEGVTVSITPETQKLKSQNIATYSATFTVGPNVPSGTYQVTLVAYSSNGMFDKITFEFVVP